MVRPLSPEKRLSLLSAATQAVAEQGVLATTSGIARRAGVAEGTLFTYFENKDALFQAVYLHLKHSLSESMMPGYPHQGSYRECLQYIFDGYVQWGLQHPEGRLAIGRLKASGLINTETMSLGMEPFLVIIDMMQNAIQASESVDAPLDFLAAIIEDFADTTIEFTGKYPTEGDRYLRLGFDLLWKAISA